MNFRMAGSLLRNAFIALPLSVWGSCPDSYAATAQTPLVMSQAIADPVSAAVVDVVPANKLAPAQAVSGAPSAAANQVPELAETMHRRLIGPDPFSSAEARSAAEQRSVDIATTVTVVAERNIAPPVVPAAVEPVAQVVGQWEIKISDRTLNATLRRWSHTAGWQLMWELPTDYLVETHAVISGSFEDAVAAVGVSLGQAEAPVKMIFYAGNKVLRIIAKGRG